MLSEASTLLTSQLQPPPAMAASSLLSRLWLVGGAKRGRYTRSDAGAAGAAAASGGGQTTLVALAASVSGVCFGYEIGVVDAVLSYDSFAAWAGYGPGNESYEAGTTGWVVASFLIGCLVGSAAVSVLADTLGRKRSIVLGGAVFALGGVAQCAAPSIATLYVARAVSGAAIGVLSMAAPLYISETAPAAIRGKLVAMEQLAITLGILLASVVNASLYVAPGGELPGDAQWRTALAAQIVPGLLLLVVMLPLPRSPRWLMSVGRAPEAADALSKLRGLPGGAANPAVAGELAEIAAGMGEDSSARGGAPPAWADLLAPRVRGRLGIAIWLQVCQQFTGINVILYYAASLFARMGVDATAAATWLVVVNAALLVLGTLPGLALVEHPRVGRRNLLLAGGAAMAVAHALVCVFVSLAGTSGGAFAWAAVVCMLTFTVAFSATWGPAVWVVQSEILPLDVRARGTAIATMANWASNAVIGKAAPFVLNSIGAFTYALLAAACVAMTLFVWVYLPETAGVSLEDMGALFGAPGGGGKAKGAAGGVSGGADASSRLDRSGSSGSGDHLDREPLTGGGA